MTAQVLFYGQSKKPLAWVKPDDRYPTMWRIHWPDGEVSDMVNLPRAKDAATVLCRSKHPSLPHDGMLVWKQDSGQSPAVPPPMRLGEREAPGIAPEPGALAREAAS